MNPSSENITPIQTQEKKANRSTDTATLLDLIVEETTKKQLIEMELDHKRFEYDFRIAQVMSRAGYFYAGGDDKKNALTEEQAMAKIVIGRAWGMDQATSIQRIFVVNGKPSIENEYYAAKLMDAGWSWDLEWINGQGKDCRGCRLWLSFRGEPKVDRKGEQAFVEFTYEMAEAARLINKEGPWQTWRANMFMWKCIANVRRFYAPNILTGALMYAEALDVSDLEVSSRETPLPSQRAPLSDKIDTVLEKRTSRRQKVDTAAGEQVSVAGETKQADRDTKTPEAETKSPDSETKPAAAETKPAEVLKAPIMPVTADQIKAIRKFEGHLGTDLFYALLGDFELRTPEMINTFELAARVIVRMQTEWDKAKPKA